MTTTFKKYYDRLKKYAIFLITGIIVISEFIEMPKYIQTISILTLCIMILEILFEIRDNVSKKSQNITFGEFYDVSLEMKKIILEELKSKNKIKIRAIGMSMGHAWQFFYNTLNPILTNPNDSSLVELEIAMLNSSWADLESINPYWRQKSNTNRDLISQFIHISEANINQKKWSIKLYSYSYMPNWHGVLINDNILYLSTCYWKDNLLQGGENPYEFIKSDGTKETELKISHFLNWFNHIKKINEKV